MELLPIYLEALRRCAPETLLQRVLRPDMPRSVVAIGKCAGALIDGLGTGLDDALVALPDGYRKPAARHVGMDVFVGGHPAITSSSFACGEQLLRFVDRYQNVLFLISGGGSACAEVARPPFTNEDLSEVNERLLKSGLPIGEINIVRRQLSALKGGKLLRRVKGRAVTLVYSDVATGALADVASGPTVPDPSTVDDAIRILEQIGHSAPVILKLRGIEPLPAASWPPNEVELIADNETLTAAAAAIISELGMHPVRWDGQMECDVEAAAVRLASRAAALVEGEVLVAGGEPTVKVLGSGVGGRCCELAARFLRDASPQLTALFGSSDGIDGNSGVAGIEITSTGATVDRHAIDTRLANSDSLAAVALHGHPIMIPTNGNNLRDLYLLARG